MLTISDSKDEKQVKSNNSLLNYYEFLKKSQTNGTLPCEMDLERLHNDIENGMYFDSSIPQGFGVGSSGALVAAIYGMNVDIPFMHSPHAFYIPVILSLLVSILISWYFMKRKWF